MHSKKRTNLMKLQETATHYIVKSNVSEKHTKFTYRYKAENSLTQHNEYVIGVMQL